MTATQEQQMGVQLVPGLGRFPALTWPEHVSRVLNLELLDDDYARGVTTSPIWAE